MEKIKLKIKQKGLKISWVAKQIGISQPSLSMYLNGNREMPIEIKNKINKLLW